MKAYLINLDRRPDRLNRFVAQARDLGFAFERVVAVDGQEPALQARAEAAGPGRFCPQIGAYELACFESHRKAWAAILASGDTHGLVMEDDLVLAPDFAELLRDGWVPEGADIVRVETWLTQTRFDLRPVGTVQGRKIHRMRSTMLGGGAYVLSGPAARRLLEATREIVDPVDHVLFSEDSPLFAALAIHQLIPAAAIQGFKHDKGVVDDWAQSSLEDNRRGIRGPRAEFQGLMRSQLLRRFLYRLWRVNARLQGHLFIWVPFR